MALVSSFQAIRTALVSEGVRRWPLTIREVHNAFVSPVTAAQSLPLDQELAINLMLGFCASLSSVIVTLVGITFWLEVGTAILYLRRIARPSLLSIRV